MNFLNALPSMLLEQGLIYALLAMGVLSTYTILDFPDISVDGTFPPGRRHLHNAHCRRANPMVALLAAVAGGAVAGLCTGLIHVKLKVRDLFSGIIVSTALYSINLKISGGKSLATIGRQDVTLFQNNALADFLGGIVGDYSTLVIIMLVVLAVKILLDLFLKTRAGYLLRAVGDNERVVTALACDKGRVKIIGLMIANAFAALSGAVLCQHQRMFEVSMGTGSMVLALASVIIGMNLFRRVSFIKGTTAAIIGAIVYRMCVSTGHCLRHGRQRFETHHRRSVPHHPRGGAFAQGREEACLNCATSARSIIPEPCRKSACLKTSISPCRRDSSSPWSARTARARPACSTYFAALSPQIRAASFSAARTSCAKASTAAPGAWAASTRIRPWALALP